MTDVLYSNYHSFLTELKHVDILIHKKDDVKHSFINNKLYVIHKNILDVQQHLIQNKDLDKDNKPIVLQLYRYLEKYIDILYKYNDNKEQVSLRRNFRILTIINTIFLPLGLITGYFGMNFKSMGTPTHGKGILTINNSHNFVFILFFTSISIIVFLFYSKIL